MIISKQIIGIIAVAIIAVAAVAAWQVYPSLTGNQPTPTPTPTPTTSPTEAPTTSPSPTTSPTTAPTTSPTTSPTTDPTATPTPTPEPVAWNLNYTGGKSLSMTNIEFKTQATAKGVTYAQNDSNTNTTWAGIPLYQLVNYYADSGKISYGVLSLGYNVTIVAGDGYKLELSGMRVANNQGIIVANNANGTALTGNYYPLTLAGGNLTKKEGVKDVVQIQINTALPSNLTFTVVAANGTKITFNRDDIAAMPTVCGMAGTNTHGAVKNLGNYTGISMQYLANLVGGMTSTSFVRLTAADTYTKDYSYEQIVSGTGYGTYDTSLNAVNATQPIMPIIAYAVDGNLLEASNGQMRSAFISSEGLLTISSIWVKSVVQLNVVQTVS